MGRLRGSRSISVTSNSGRDGVRTAYGDLAFGIFRPLTPESASDIQQVLETAQEDIHEYLDWYGFDRMSFHVRDHFGVTILPRKNALRAMQDERFANRFKFSQMVGEIALCDEFAEPLEVPIGGFNWYGTRGKIFVGQFEASDTTDQLDDQTQQLAEIIRGADGKHIEIGVADHVSMYKVKGGSPFVLSEGMRFDIGNIVRQHLAAGDVGSVVLDSVIVGDGYHTPETTT